MLSYPRLSTAGYPFSEQGYIGLPDPAAATAALYANLVSGWPAAGEVVRTAVGWRGRR